MKFYRLTAIVLFCQIFVSCTSDSYPFESDSTEVSDTTPEIHLGPEPETSFNLPPDAPGEFPFDSAGFKDVFNLRVYLSDPSETATNLRKEPNGKVLEKLSPDEDYMLYITAQQGEWFKVTDIECFNEELMPKYTSGWLHKSVVGCASRHCEAKGTPCYRYPDTADSLFLGRIPVETGLRVERLYFDWVEVTYPNEDGKTSRGWIKQDCTCGNPVTTCP